MVELGAAGTVKHTALVVLEAGLVGLNSDRNRPMLKDGERELVLMRLWDGVEVIERLDVPLCRLRPARAVHARVVVVLLRVDALILEHVLVCLHHLAALAAGANTSLWSVAVDELLLT